MRRNTLVLLAVALLLPAALLAACGDDDGDAGDGPASAIGASTGGTLGGPETLIPPGAGRYVPALHELRGDFDILATDTFGITLQLFAGLGPFGTLAEGEDLATQWGYHSGFQAYYEPDGLLSGVLQGRYFVTVETHLFAMVAGARSAFDTYADRYAQVAGSELQTPKGLANQSIAFRLLAGKVGESQIDAVYHRFIFRRGNMVASVQTAGAAPFMTIDPARDIAVIIDQRALGERVASEPTPQGQGGAPTPAPGN